MSSRGAAQEKTSPWDRISLLVADLDTVVAGDVIADNKAQQSTE